MVPVTGRLMELMFERVRDHGCGMWYSARRRQVPTAPGALWRPIRRLARKSTGQVEWSGRLGRVPCEPLVLLESLERQRGGLTEDAFLFAQLLRIPTTEACTVHRLLQVAFDAGQLIGSGGMTRLTKVNDGFMRMYATLGLGQPKHYCDDPTGLTVPASLVELIARLPIS